MIIPVALDLDWPTKQSVIASIREQHERYGFYRFILAAPSGGWRSVGYPSKEAWDRLAHLFAEVKDELLTDGIECGWWITATLKSGRSERFSQTVNADGKPSFFANCPLDPAFRATFSEDVARFADIARPSFIITEDDYSVHAASPPYGCFCEQHLAEFYKRTGHPYTREELVSAFRSGTKEGYGLLREWRMLARDSLVALSQDIRRKVDQKTPEIPIGYMESGLADRDGECTGAVCRALAGEHHTPFCRYYGMTYCGTDAKDIPTMLTHALYVKEHAPDILAYHESDAYPHTRFFLSAAHMRAIMSIVYSMGFVGSTFQTQQLLDDPNEEVVYAVMLQKEQKRFAALQKAVMQCRMRGVQIAYDPFWNTVDPCVHSTDPLWARPLALFGIPYVTTPQRVVCWDVRQARYADHETVMEHLSRGLILDGAAAAELAARGYGKYLGVIVGKDVAEGALGYDLAAREVLRDGVLPTLRGRHMPSPHMFAVGRNGYLPALTITDPRVEVLSDLIGFDREVITPAMTRFKNELGGRVAIMGVTLYHEGTKCVNLSQSLYNYRRQRLMQELVNWCGGNYVTVANDANVMCILNEPTQPDVTDFRAIVTLVNLTEDSLERVVLELPQHLKNPHALSYLTRGGRWIRQPFTEEEGRITIERSLGFGEPMCLRLS